MESHWDDPEHAAHYLARAGELPHRQEAEAVLLGDLERSCPGGCSTWGAATVG